METINEAVASADTLGAGTATQWEPRNMTRWEQLIGLILGAKVVHRADAYSWAQALTWTNLIEQGRANDRSAQRLAYFLDVYWCTAYAEGQASAERDTPDGSAQRAMQALMAAILGEQRDAVAAERKRLHVLLREAAMVLSALIDVHDYPPDNSTLARLEDELRKA